MLVRHISKENLLAAVEVASRSLGNDIVLEDLHPTNQARTSWRFRTKVKYLDHPGHRVHLHSWGDVMEANVGSRYCPVRFADSCSCASDAVPTDTIEPWTWRLGEPALPTPESVNRQREVVPM